MQNGFNNGPIKGPFHDHPPVALIYRFPTPLMFTIEPVRVELVECFHAGCFKDRADFSVLVMVLIMIRDSGLIRLCIHRTEILEQFPEIFVERRHIQPQLLRITPCDRVGMR